MSDIKEAGEPLPRELSMILESIYIAAGVGRDPESRVAYLSRVLNGVQTSCSHIDDHVKALEIYWAMNMSFLCVTEDLET